MRALGLALWMLATALASGLPEEKPFTNPVTLNTGLSGIGLEVALRQLARSIGLTPVLSDIPNLVVKDPLNRIPFKQAWDLLIQLKPGSLDYVLLPNGVIRVGAPESLQPYRPQPPAPPPPAAPTPPPPVPAAPVATLREYTLQSPSTDIENSINTFLPELAGRFRVLPHRLLVLATPAQQQALEELLGLLDKPAPPPTPAIPAPITLVQSYPLQTHPAETIAALKEYVPGLAPLYFAEGNALIVRATAEQHQMLMQALLQLKALLPPPPPPPAAPPPAPTPPPIEERSYLLQNASADNLAKALSTLLGTTPRILAEPRTNRLLATGTASELERLEKLLPALDSPTPQVALRVRVESVDSNQAHKLGIDWEGQIAGINLSLSAGKLQLGLGQDPFSAIGATLNALQEQGAAKSELRIEQRVREGETALFGQGGTVVVVASNPNASSTLPSFQYGIAVEITPKLNGEEIALDFETRIGQEPIPGPSNTFRLPQSSLRTRINLRSGETVVLGGLVNEQQNQQQQGLPLLSEIPLIGQLFKQQSQQRSQSSLLYVINAVLVEPASAPRK